MIHIVTGLAGSGKTLVTKYLQEKINAVVINTDTLRSKLFPDGEYTPTGDFTPEQLTQVYEALRAIAFYLIKTAPERHFIFEGTFRYESQRDNLIEELEGHNYPYSLILVQINTQVAKERIDYRHEYEGAPDIFEEYLEQQKIFEKPTNAYLIENSGTREELNAQLDTYLLEFGL